MPNRQYQVAPHGCLRGVLGLVAIVIVAIVLASAFSHGGGSGAASTAPAYRVSDVSVQPIDSAEVTVSWWIENVGKGPGTPTCEIQAATPGYAGTGFDSATAKNPLQPGSTVQGSDTFTITNNMAANVQASGVSVKCS